MNIVLDTNVIISSICFPFSKPRQAIDLARSNGNILFSTDTFNELKNVLLKKKFNNYIDLNTRIEFLDKYQKSSQEIFITIKIHECRDVKDNKFLELAVNGDAEYLITGDMDLLILNPFRNINILTPNSFIFSFIK